MNREMVPSQESLSEDLLLMWFYSAEGDNNLNPSETDLWGSVNPNALLSTAIGGPSGGGDDDVFYSILGMQAFVNIRQ
jgi:hypothetical protein